MHTFFYSHQPDHYSPAPQLGLFGLLPPESERLAPPPFSQWSPDFPQILPKKGTAYARHLS